MAFFNEQEIVDIFNKRREKAKGKGDTSLPQISRFFDNVLGEGSADFAFDEEFKSGLKDNLVTIKGKKYPVGVLGNIMVGVLSKDLNIPFPLLAAGGLGFSSVLTFGELLLKGINKLIPEDKKLSIQDIENLTNSPIQELKDNKFYLIGRELAEKKEKLTTEDLSKALEKSGSEFIEADEMKLEKPSKFINKVSTITKESKNTMSVLENLEQRIAQVKNGDRSLNEFLLNDLDPLNENSVYEDSFIKAYEVLQSSDFHAMDRDDQEEVKRMLESLVSGRKQYSWNGELKDTPIAALYESANLDFDSVMDSKNKLNNPSSAEFFVPYLDLSDSGQFNEDLLKIGVEFKEEFENRDYWEENGYMAINVNGFESGAPSRMYLKLAKEPGTDNFDKEYFGFVPGIGRYEIDKDDWAGADKIIDTFPLNAETANIFTQKANEFENIYLQKTGKEKLDMFDNQFIVSQVRNGQELDEFEALISQIPNVLENDTQRINLFDQPIQGFETTDNVFRNIPAGIAGAVQGGGVPQPPTAPTSETVPFSRGGVEQVGQTTPAIFDEARSTALQGREQFRQRFFS